MGLHMEAFDPVRANISLHSSMSHSEGEKRILRRISSHKSIFELKKDRNDRPCITENELDNH